MVFAPAASAGGGVGDCNTWKSSRAPYTGYAYCSQLALGDKFRVKVTCINPQGKQWTIFGPWKRNTEKSSAKCSDSPNVGVLQVGVSFSA
ncbi:hypothetical protein [Streptomyces sudanensis]|uniref:hypothetical protein n=1 Tax=Streptomyces sudanensis TaxID=436397 RepID=UPI0020CD4C2C|nr:hypothetical protein [Streptomyces sudanensis]MCP9957604.1 hypothetical protein [Streptomyces sudanensis]MCQ0001853.1 hypothetical protein [Streptomyces sudanensis]